MEVRSKVWVYGRSLAVTADSNPVGGMDVCCCVLGLVRYRSLRRADPSSRRALPSVCHRVLSDATISRYTYNEYADRSQDYERKK